MKRKVTFNKFDSVESFSRWLSETPQTKLGKAYNSSMHEGSLITEFTGTGSFAEADRLMKYGDKENAAKINATIAKIKAKGKGNETRNNLHNSPCGFMPIVPKVLAGDPCNMLAIKRQQYQSTKVLNVVYNINIPATAPASMILETAVKVANIIASLEKNGYRINLHVMTYYNGNRNTGAGVMVKIKDSGKYMDTLRIAYPLVNPSFFRRHCFAYFERAEKYILPAGYGIPVDVETIKSYIPLQNYCYLSFDICKGKTEQEITKMIETAK